jgi:hypothetical protein
MMLSLMNIQFTCLFARLVMNFVEISQFQFIKIKRASCDRKSTNSAYVNTLLPSFPSAENI